MFQKSKLLWIIGAFLFSSEVVYRVSVYSIGNRPDYWFPYPLMLIAVFLSFLAKVGLIYSTNQMVSDQTPTFSEVWDFCKSRVKPIFGLYFVNIPLIMFSVLLVTVVVLSVPSVSLTFLVGILLDFLFNAVFTISICTIVINNLEAGPSLWTGVLIVINNFFHVIALSSVYFILQILLSQTLGIGLLGIFLIVPLTVTMTLAYRVFVTKDSYPALSNLQSTAY